MTLRKQLIRLAHDNPGDLRDALLPLLSKQGGYTWMPSGPSDPAFEALYWAVEDGDGYLIRFTGLPTRARARSLDRLPEARDALDTGGNTSVIPSHYLQQTYGHASSAMFRKLPPKDRKELDVALKLTR